MFRGLGAKRFQGLKLELGILWCKLSGFRGEGFRVQKSSLGLKVQKAFQNCRYLVPGNIKLNGFRG